MDKQRIAAMVTLYDLPDFVQLYKKWNKLQKHKKKTYKYFWFRDGVSNEKQDAKMWK